MSRVLLADDSPHAQRMGVRILQDEGHQVVAVSDGETAMLRLTDFAPHAVIADGSMPGVSGYEICDYIKSSGKHSGVCVFLTFGAVEPVDRELVQRVGADGTLKKPFEASLLLDAVAQAGPHSGQAAAPPLRGPQHARSVVILDEEQVRAAVTLALDSAMDTLVDAIAERVLAALKLGRPAPATFPGKPVAVPRR